MPAGAAAAPRAFPARLVIGRELPQHEIGRVLLVRVDRDAGTCLLVLEVPLRQAAIVRHGVDAEQHLARRLIGVAAFDQHVDQRDHLRDVVGGARLHGGCQAAQLLHVREELVGRLLGDVADRVVQRQVGEVAKRTRVDLVIDVGDVADIGDVGLAIDLAQQPEEEIEDDDGARIADVGEVINRRTADIHAHVLTVERDELFLGAGQRVVEAQRHEGPQGLPARVRFVLNLGQRAPCQRM